jgi:hypothetical protein
VWRCRDRPHLGPAEKRRQRPLALLRDGRAGGHGHIGVRHDNGSELRGDVDHWSAAVATGVDAKGLPALLEVERERMCLTCRHRDEQKKRLAFEALLRESLGDRICACPSPRHTCSLVHREQWVKGFEPRDMECLAETQELRSCIGTCWPARARKLLEEV